MALTAVVNRKVKALINQSERVLLRAFDLLEAENISKEQCNEVRRLTKTANEAIRQARRLMRQS